MYFTFIAFILNICGNSFLSVTFPNSEKMQVLAATIMKVAVFWDITLMMEAVSRSNSTRLHDAVPQMSVVFTFKNSLAICFPENLENLKVLFTPNVFTNGCRFDFVFIVIKCQQ